MTARELENALKEKFGPYGIKKSACEAFLHIQHGAINWEEIESNILPGGKQKRYCPKSIAEYLTQNRRPAYYSRLVR